MKIKIILLFLLTYATSSFAYVISKSESGSNIKWNLASEDLLLNIDPNPVGTKAIGITSSEVIQIFEESLNQWDQYTDFALKTKYTTNLPAGKNKVFFTSDVSYFGSGVLAITEINYNIDNGAISSADIIINESAFNILTFTADETQSSYLKAYLGDVFTHELGHFLGLSHSEVVGSSMVYSVFKNQHTLHSDDFSGVMDNYGKTLEPGELYGEVVGGGGLAVFGAHVLLLSSNDGKVVQSQITDESGKFHFKNLKLEDSYYFYVTPFKQISSISKYYTTVVNQYCEQGKNYKGSFYTQCGPRSKGSPQGFALSDEQTSIDVGSITIRCDENLVPDYLKAKMASIDRSYEINPTLREFSKVFVGMFSNSEIVDGPLGKGDEFNLDLRSLDFGEDNSGNYLVKLSMLSTGLGSAFDFQVDVKRDDGASYTTYTSTLDETGKIITDFEINLNLSSVASNNLFSIKVFPIELSTTQKYEIFSTSTSLMNEVSQYTLSAQVGSYVGSNFVPYKLYAAEAYDDNTLCLEGNVNYTTQAYTPLTAISDTSQNNEVNSGLGISCGTIDLDGGDGGASGGPLSFAIGFIFMFLISQLSHLTRRVD